MTSELLPPTLLASLLNSTQEMMYLHGRLKLSAFERDMALFVIEHRQDGDNKGKTYEKNMSSINPCHLNPPFCIGPKLCSYLFKL